MSTSQSLIVACFLLLGPVGLAGKAEAWGRYGHLTVCDLAYRNLTSKSRLELKKLFQVRTGGITVKGRGRLADRRYTSYNLGCLEEDELPRRHPDDHFINVDRETKSISSGVCPSDRDCILSGIGRDFDTLKDTGRSNEERVFALMALGHWIGDVHQPLHVSYSDDRGGNRVNVKLKGKCGTSAYRVKNLHGVWDNCLLEAGLFERVRQRADFKKSWGRNTMTYRAVDTLQANTALSTERELAGTHPWKWANESYEIALRPEVLYCSIVEDACSLHQLSNLFPTTGKSDFSKSIKHTWRISNALLRIL